MAARSRRARRPRRGRRGRSRGRPRMSAASSLPGLAELALEPVADHGVTDRLRERRGRAAARRRARRRAGTSAGSGSGSRPSGPADRRHRSPASGTGGAGAPQQGGRSGREALAPLGAAALEDHLSGARRHAGAEAVLALAAADVGLVGAFHGGELSLVGRCAGRDVARRGGAQYRRGCDAPSYPQARPSRELLRKCCMRRLQSSPSEAPPCHDSPQLWRHRVEAREIPAKCARFYALSVCLERIERASDGAMLALPATAERSLRHGWSTTTEPTADACGTMSRGRLREALNETTYATWFGAAAAGGSRRRHVLARRPERLHARVDRGALPRLRARLPRATRSAATCG